MTGLITIPLHIGDFLSGTMHMDTLEKGAYIMLIVAHYQSGVKGIPNDDLKLSRIAGVTPKVWKRIRPILAEKFDTSGDFWVSKKCVLVLREVEQKSSNQRAKALKRHNSGDATAQPRHCQPKPKPKPIIKNTKKDFKKEFEETFWPLAVKKVSKDAALKAYEKARARAPSEEILPAWKAMNARWGEVKGTEDWQFVPHPATWLNQGRWQDETEPEKPAYDPNRKTLMDFGGDYDAYKNYLAEQGMEVLQ